MDPADPGKGAINLLLALAVGTAWLWMGTWGRKAWFPASPSPETWGCGFGGAVSPRIQYTASSFTETVVRNYQGVYPLRFRRMNLKGFFPSPSRFGVFESDWVLGGILLPAIRRLEKRFARVRGMQQGKTSIYILYILVVFLLALLWGIGSPP
jgi:hydrogenase-4 component B